jgi:hypothetical protein
MFDVPVEHPIQFDSPPIRTYGMGEFVFKSADAIKAHAGVQANACHVVPLTYLTLYVFNDPGASGVNDRIEKLATPSSLLQELYG